MKNDVLQQISLPDLNGGLNTHDPEYDIADNQSPDMLNLWYKDMALCKRPGQTWLSKRSDMHRVSEPYNGMRIVHAGTTLYRWNAEGMESFIGEFDPAEGYPAGANPGDYSIAHVAGQCRENVYEAGDTAVYDGVQRISAAATGTVTAAGNARVVITRSWGNGLPFTIAVSVRQGDSSSQVANKIRAALIAQTELAAYYDVGGTADDVTLTRLVAGSQDEKLGLIIENGTCEGLVKTVSSDVSAWHKAMIWIKDGIGDTPGVFCEFGDRLYYFSGAEIWEITADYTVQPVQPYIPVVMINAAPDLDAGDDNESYNLIGSGFRVWYNGVGESAINRNTVYRLPQKALDNSKVAVSVDGVDLNEGIHFSVDRAKGTVNFAGGTAPFGAPPKGTNNVWITAYKIAREEDGLTPKKKRITGCTAAVRFGGETAGVVGGTRVFVMANPEYPYRYWHSDLGLHVSAGMRYFPDTSEELLDQNSEAITAAAKMGDELIIFKENSIFAMGYAFDGEDIYYPVRECHSTLGCDMPGSLQLIDNRLVFAHSKSGVFMLVSSNNELENIVKPISANINTLLLRENDLNKACSCDYDRCYWLCTGGTAYVWDYDTTAYYNYADYDKAQKRLAWYRFDNIDAAEFFEDKGLCYEGNNGLVRFTKNRNDFGQSINAYFKSKAFDMGRPEEEKTFVYLYPSFSMDGNILVDITAGNEKIDAFREVRLDIRSFDWNDFNWSAFTWNRIKFARTFAMRLNMRHAAFLQVRVLGDEIDRGVGLSGLRITYYVNKKMKR